MLAQLDPAVVERLKAVLASGDPRAIAEILNGVIQRKLRQNNWLDVAFASTTGTIFDAPSKAVGRTGMKVNRGQILETFQVAGTKVALVPQRYASMPSIDAGDLEDGNLVRVADMIQFAQWGIEDQLLLDGYSLLSAAQVNGGANFHLVVDTGATLADGAPAYLSAVKRQMDIIINAIADVTHSRKVRGILARTTMAADLYTHLGLSNINQAKFELLSPLNLPGEYKDVPIFQLNGATDDYGNDIFPSNEVYMIGEGAGTYSIPKDIRVQSREQENIRVAWEVWTERIMAMWFPELVHRIYVINTTTPGTFKGLASASTIEINLQSKKYVDASTVTAITLKVYSGADPGAGVAGSAITSASVDSTGKYLNVKFTSALSPGTYKIYNTAGLHDIGGTAFAATSDGAPIATFTI